MKLDDKTKQMLHKEIARLVDEASEGLTEIEKVLVWEIMQEQVKFFGGLPNKYKVIIYNVLHHYACIIEGLDKK